MKMTLGVAAMLLFLLVGVRHPAFAMWCGGNLISNGMTKLDVVTKCGQPDLKDVESLNSSGVRNRDQFNLRTSVIEVWHYNCGSGSFNRSLVFDGGILVSVKDGNSRGSGPEKCK